MMCSSVPSVSKPGNSGTGRRCPVASSHSDDGPGRMRMPCIGQIGSQLLDALGVVPHAVGVDDVAAGVLGDLDHAPVDVGGHAGDHVLRRLAEPLGPVAAHELVVAADAAGGDDHGRRAQLERRRPPSRELGCPRAHRARARAPRRRTPSTAPPVDASARRPGGGSAARRARAAAASRTRRTNGSTVHCTGPTIDL